MCEKKEDEQKENGGKRSIQVTEEGKKKRKTKDKKDNKKKNWKRKEVDRKR